MQEFHQDLGHVAWEDFLTDTYPNTLGSSASTACMSRQEKGHVMKSDAQKTLAENGIVRAL